jgi:hypothetical protein
VFVTAISGMPAGGMVTNNDMYIACFKAKGIRCRAKKNGNMLLWPVSE